MIKDLLTASAVVLLGLLIGLLILIILGVFAKYLLGVVITITFSHIIGICITGALIGNIILNVVKGY